MFSNNINISIKFDNEQRQYHPNEKITGQVVVEVLKPSNCRSLIVAHGWQTHGKGNKN